MQARHLDRQTYFNESAHTTRNHYIGYVEKFIRLNSETRVLEIGCGEGGNLLPFAEKGCRVTGIDCVDCRIAQARKFFSATGYDSDFRAVNFFDMPTGDRYDVILIHDVIEHIEDKTSFLRHLKLFLAREGIVFWGFPAWQMPFGGHQQICHGKIAPVLPFIHLLPNFLYSGLLTILGEKVCIKELLETKRCGISIERFEKQVTENGFQIMDRQLWFINPHYEQKFRLQPRKLASCISKIKYFRNFCATSCFYITRLVDGDILYSSINSSAK